MYRKDHDLVVGWFMARDISRGRLFDFGISGTAPLLGSLLEAGFILVRVKFRTRGKRLDAFTITCRQYLENSGHMRLWWTMKWKIGSTQQLGEDTPGGVLRGLSSRSFTVTTFSLLFISCDGCLRLRSPFFWSMICCHLSYEHAWKSNRFWRSWFPALHLLPSILKSSFISGFSIDSADKGSKSGTLYFLTTEFDKPFSRSREKKSLTDSGRFFLWISRANIIEVKGDSHIRPLFPFSWQV